MSNHFHLVIQANDKSVEERKTFGGNLCRNSLLGQEFC